ncbi:MAG TPA: phospholipase, partial [Dermatophilaceae bacterium]|nr:phospholipase [Dermatophilaceae bacterium]
MPTSHDDTIDRAAATARYAGRHRLSGAVSDQTRSKLTAVTSRLASARVSKLPRALRRPIASGAVVLGVFAATAAGYAHSAQPGSPLTALTAAMATSSAGSDAGPTAHDVARDEVADKLGAAAGRRQDATAAKARAAAAAKAAALAKQRKAAAARAAREQARKSILARAQADPRAVGRLLAAETYGWTGSQFSCLNSLWTKESGWSYRADNPSSSAYGIPQALPGAKMAAFGSDWAHNPATQIKWGLSYIKSRYG